MATRRSGGTPLAATELAATTATTIDISDALSASVQVVYSDAAPAVKTFTSATSEVQTLTYAAKAATTHQDFVIVENAAGLSFAVALTKPVAEVQTLTFPAFAGVTDRDYIVVYNAAGTSFAVYADKTGSSIAPTGAAYVAASYKVKADISADTTAAEVAARFETAFNTLTGFTASVTTDDTAADGTMTLTQVTKGPTTNPVPHDLADVGAGSLAGVQTTAGVASEAPVGPLWAAVNAARKGLADISSDTTAAQVAARAETAWNLLTGFTASITSDDTAADGTMTFTQVSTGPVTNPVPKNAAESGAGSITGVQSTAGLSTTLNLTDNEITITAHPYVTGTKVAATTDSADFPSGLSATNYWVIDVDADTIQLATSLANAVAGTAVDLADEGTGTHTLTAATSSGNVAKLQGSNDGTNWTDVASATVTISTSAGSAVWSVGDTRYARVLYTPSAGQVNLAIHTCVVR